MPADVVSTVDVWTGALPARLGDRLSGTVVINTREGGKDRLRTSGGVGLISTNVTVEGPLHAGRGSFVLFGRRTYIDAITAIGYRLGLFDFTVPYDFTDLYGKLTHRIGELGSIAISGYWDSEVMTPPERRLPLIDYGEFDWKSRLTSVSFRHPIGGAMLLEARVGYSGFSGAFASWDARSYLRCTTVPARAPCELEEAVDTTVIVAGRAKTQDVVAGADVSVFRRRHTLRGGVRLDRYAFDHNLSTARFDDDYLPEFIRRSTLTNIAAYVEDEWLAGERWAVRAGVRLLDAGRLGTAWLPRLGARWQATRSLAFSAGGGRYAQALRSLKDDESALASFMAYDVLTPQPSRPGLARGTDIVLGGEYVDGATQVRIDAFRKTQDALLLAAETEPPFDARPLTLDDYRVGNGSARGIELSVRSAAGRFAIGLAYALSAAERSAGTDRFPPRFERRHQLDVSSDYRWGEAGLVNARLVLASGQPFTPVVALAQPLDPDPISQQWHWNNDVLVTGEHNSARLPRYLRLDIAARRSFQRRWFGRDGILTPYLQIVNVLNHRNALLPELQPYGPPRVEYWPQFPFLPSVGLEWRF